MRDVDAEGGSETPPYFGARFTDTRVYNGTGEAIIEVYELPQGGEGSAHGGGDHCGIGQMSVAGEADEGAAPSAERFET
jgi:hypothetical protein